MTLKNKHPNKRVAQLGEKRCFVSKQTYSRETMIRFVVSPEREVVFDVDEKLPGAGMWLYPTQENMQLAINKKMFNKAAQGTVKIDENLYNIVLERLKSKIIHLLGLARKSGCLAFGYEGVKKMMQSSKIGIAFEANDASENGTKKLYKPNESFIICNYLTRENLGGVTAQDEQVHLAVQEGKIATLLENTVKKIDLLSNQQTKG